jgi:hypothetical protein
MSQQYFSNVDSIPGVPNIEYVVGNDSVAVGPNPATHAITIIGNTTQGVSVTNTAPYTETITVSSATTTQLGVVVFATNAETIAGTVTNKAVTPDDLKAKLGSQTLHGLSYGNATTGVIQWLAEAANGQIPIGSVGNPPVIANITSLDGSITITNGPGSIDLSAFGYKGTSTTVGAVTNTIITIPLGAVAGTYQVEAIVKAFNAAGPYGAGFHIFATYRTDGTTATLINQQPIYNEDTALEPSDAVASTSGGNAIIQVTGVTGLTIVWNADAELI